jgi:hypothetical protein
MRKPEEAEIVAYFQSFMQNLQWTDFNLYTRVVSRAISKEAFTQLVRDWATDITTKK